MAESKLQGINKKVVNFTWNPQGANTYQSVTVPTGVNKNQIISIIPDTTTTNIAALLTTINVNGLAYLILHQVYNVGATELTGSLTVFYR